MVESAYNPSASLYRHLERPARLIKVICQMVLGAGIAIALILKVYMLVLTDHTCTADLISLGNDIRCANTLELMAYGLALYAGFEMAHLLFTEGMEVAVRPVILGLSSAFLFILADLRLETANWQIAMVIAALSLSMAGIFFLKDYFLRGRRSKADVEAGK